MTMARITEDYVSFETAKLLKDKGFNEPALAYTYGDGMISYYSRPRITDALSVEAGRIPLPTLQMAMKWLREVHNIHIDVGVGADVDNPNHIFYAPTITIFVPHESVTYLGDMFEEEYETYEEAAEAAIKYYLENLI